MGSNDDRRGAPRPPGAPADVERAGRAATAPTVAVADHAEPAETVRRQPAEADTARAAPDVPSLVATVHGVGALASRSGAAARGVPVSGDGETMAAPTAQTAPARPPRAKRPSLSPTAGEDAEAPRYRLGDRLGVGGMGEVLLAVDERIGREVAVKRVRTEDPTPVDLARFVREARVQGRLEHPAVVPVHDLAVGPDGQPYFVMKRLSGTTLAEILRAGEPPAGERARLLRAFVEVCLAVEFAHRRGVVHRDLKPANIMLGDFGEVYVLDWGVARDDGDPEPEATAAPRPREVRPTPVSSPALAVPDVETVVGTILGTPGYMAPEQLDGARVGPAADVYALGCILFELVAGERLHPRGLAALSSTALGADARPSRVRPDAPPELDAICTRATRLAPGERTPSARALGDEVQAFLDGDRDLAQRRGLAAGHLAEARGHLAGGDDDERRQRAMRAAGRALALDPTLGEAAELVTGLMLRPPTQVPAEVTARLEEIDVETARAQGRLAAWSLVGYLGFVPFMAWSGIRQPALVVAFAAATLGSVAQVLALVRRGRFSTVGLYASAVINAALIGLVTCMVGPLVVAPTLAATTLMAYAAHPRLGRISVVGAILGAAVVVPWGLELAGLTPSTYAFVDGDIVLHSPVFAWRAAPTLLAFACLLVSLLTIVAVLTRMVATRQRAAALRLELQAWQVRQLVPAATPSAASSGTAFATSPGATPTTPSGTSSAASAPAPSSSRAGTSPRPPGS